MKVGDLIRRARYPSPDGRMAGRFGKEAGVGLIIEVWGNKYKINSIFFVWKKFFYI